ncbi:unnamed protein product [Sphagnum jensenii]|uniref:Uncharacterized protein n=1 Tax=Sphagnum jensenii TaxID=128206 RepID=A0ABP1B127_9BRYO
MECIIFTYIDTGSSALSVQNKRHLQWKVLDHIPSMNNEVEFAAPAHNLLRKSDGETSTCHAHKNRSASMIDSPQAARKKRFTKLELTQLMAPQKDSLVPTYTGHEEEGEAQELSSSDHVIAPGLIS